MLSTAQTAQDLEYLPQPSGPIPGPAERRAHEKRQHRRYRLIAPVPCRIGRLDSWLVDLSLVGLAIRASEPLRIGQTYELTLQGAGCLLRFPVSVTRSYLVGFEKKHGEQLPIYHVGADFRNALEEHAGEILGVLLDHVMVQQPRLVAFVQPHDERVRNESIAFPVENFSAGGFDLLSAWPGKLGHPIVVTLRQDERASDIPTVIRSSRPADGHTFRLALEPDAACREAGRQLRDLLRRELE